MVEPVAGLNELPLDAFEVQGLPSQLRVTATTPRSLRLRLDERRRRSVIVEPQLVGEPLEGSTIDAFSVSPARVELTGPRSVLDSLEQVRTAPIEVTGVNESRTVPVALDLPRAVATTVPWQGTVRVEVESVNTTLTVNNVPVQVYDNPRYVPSPGAERVSVVLEGPAPVLRTLRQDRVMALVVLPEDADALSYVVDSNSTGDVLLEVVHPREDVVGVKQGPSAVTVVRRDR